MRTPRDVGVETQSDLPGLQGSTPPSWASIGKWRPSPAFWECWVPCTLKNLILLWQPKCPRVLIDWQWGKWQINSRLFVTFRWTPMKEGLNPASLGGRIVFLPRHPSEFALMKGHTPQARLNGQDNISTTAGHPLRLTKMNNVLFNTLKNHCTSYYAVAVKMS
jgi:hypothetical protein